MPLPTHAPPERGAPSHRRRPGLLARRALTCGAATVVAFTTTLSTAPAAMSATPMYLGAVGEVQQLSRQTGQPLAIHAYAHFSQRVPAGRMITVRAAESWHAVATAAPGSAVHGDIVRWARTLKNRRGPVMLAYHHEPEASGSARYGSAKDFIAAYRRVVSVFRAQGAHNVTFTWQMTDWAFGAASSDRRSAAKWYPGDHYVDTVGADVFNWSNCRTSRQKWAQLGALAEPLLRFARAHHKEASLPEWGSDAGPRREQWLRNAHDYLVANRDVLVAAFYFNRGPTRPEHAACRWTLNRPGEQRAFGEMARDRTHFRP
jgi:Glycosyl hydrolase family 26